MESAALIDTYRCGLITSQPFGDGAVPTGCANATATHFTGKERDAETGLDYFGARYYASTLGRFLTSDPQPLTTRLLRNPQRWNKYSYVLNNPLRLVDDDGEQDREVDYGDHKKVGGSRSWRNNNPGNIKWLPYKEKQSDGTFRQTSWAEQHGAIGKDYGGFAIFPTEEAGRTAQLELLKTQKYQDMTVRTAIETWASDSPAEQKNNYVDATTKALGVTDNTTLSTLTNEQLGKIADTQKQVEGWVEGRIEKKDTGTVPPSEQDPSNQSK